MSVVLDSSGLVAYKGDRQCLEAYRMGAEIGVRCLFDWQASHRAGRWPRTRQLTAYALSLMGFEDRRRGWTRRMTVALSGHHQTSRRKYESSRYQARPDPLITACLVKGY